MNTNSLQHKRFDFLSHHSKLPTLTELLTVFGFVIKQIQPKPRRVVADSSDIFLNISNLSHGAHVTPHRSSALRIITLIATRRGTCQRCNLTKNHQRWSAVRVLAERLIGRNNIDVILLNHHFFPLC